MDAIRGLMEFIDAAPTAFHAAQLAASALEAAGYAAGGARALGDRFRRAVLCHPQPVVGDRLPGAGGRLWPFPDRRQPRRFALLQAEAQRGQDLAGAAALNVEKYGGMLMSTWLDRPLSVAGRLIVAGEKGLETRLVNVERDLALIPNVPIHFNRNANDGVALNAQVDMLPIVGMEGADVMAAVAERAGVGRKDIAGGDLFLYNRDRATRFGVDGEFIAAPRLDDLECAYASLRALLDAKPSNTSTCCACSTTRRWAAAPSRARIPRC